MTPTRASIIVPRCKVSNLWAKPIFFGNNFLHLESNFFKLPRPDPPLTINTSDHMDFFLPPFPGAAIQNLLANNNSSSPDPDSILEQHLELVLEAVQKKLQSGLGTFSPRALKLLNALVSTEILVNNARTNPKPSL